MSVIMCRQEKVKHPYYIECLGLNLYSSQELCYVIFHHPLLTLDHFVDTHLIEFIRDELDMGFVAMKLERWQKSGENQDDLLTIILQECDYYNTAEIGKYRQKIAALRRLSANEYTKRRADYLFQYKQYGRAIAEYEKLLDSEKSQKVDDSFVGKIWNNLGVSYARVFQFSKAFGALDKAYGLLKDLNILQRLYDLTLLDPGLVLKERYQSLITEELKAEWDADFEEAKRRAEESGELKELDALFRKDSIKRMEGAVKMVKQWKQEYRNMA